MKKTLKRAAALGLSASMLLSVSALSASAAPTLPDGAPPEGGGGGGTAAPSVSYQTLDILGETAAVYIKDGVVTKNGDLIDTEGSITAAGISGTKISSDTIGQWNKSNEDGVGVAGTSGIIIKNTSTSGAANTAVRIGGEEDVFTVDGKGYNTVITLDNQDGDQANTLYTDAEWLIDNGENSNCTYPGVGVAVSAKALTIQNTYIETKGYHRPALATYDGATDTTVDLAPAVVVEDSVLASWGSEGSGSSAPTFTCMYGSARPVIINASADSYFFNSDILSCDWGSYSLDQCSGVTVSIVNSTNVNTVGGYGVYAIGASNTVDMYGTTSISAQYGAIVCASGSTQMYNLKDALSNDQLMDYYDGTLTDADAINTDGGNVMVGSGNAVTFTADISGADVISHFTAEDTYFSTLDQDVIYDGEQLENVMDTYDWLSNFAVISGGAPYFFLNYIDGPTLCYRSVNSVLELDNCQLESKVGVVIDTVLGYDTSAHGIDVADGDEYAGYDFTLSNMAVNGDILHEDYQRQMTLSLENTDLTGAVVTGTMAGWNSTMEEYVHTLWNVVDPAVSSEKTVGEVAEALAPTPVTEESVIAILEKNDTYQAFWGANLTLDADSTWTVSGTSSLASLTVADPASVKAVSGMNLTIYANVEMSNDMVDFDVTTGEEVTLTANTTYENVVLVPSFTDEGDSGNWDWAGQYIYAAFEQGIVGGYPNGTFQVNGQLTRAEAAKIIACAAGLDTNVSANSALTDIAEHWAEGYIAACEQANIISGYDDKTFQPNKQVTRAEFAKMVVEATGMTLAEGSTPVVFPDVDAAQWYANYVNILSAEGVVSGNQYGNFTPNNTITRGEAAKILALSFQLV